MAKKKNKVHSYHKDAWKRDILLLTCILRMRVQPVVPYSDIAELFLRTISTRLASITYDNIALAMNTASDTTLPNLKPSNSGSLLSPFSTVSSNTKSPNTEPSSNPILANTISAHTMLANSISTRMHSPCDDNSEKWMKDWLVQYLEIDFKGAEFRGDQTWWKARDMDSEVVGEMIKAAELDGRYVLAAKEEVKLQIRWRRDRDWRAGSVPEGPKGFVQQDVGTIGGR
ncbi:hypothetical protein BGZ57DRAFT_950826 [Hyaloscypha finlandica]|nr:hypothetical protein BGZ57DRAFT_950826 [Hyaloscypha finlandica]